jgi:hypothetical protein
MKKGRFYEETFPKKEKIENVRRGYKTKSFYDL